MDEFKDIFDSLPNKPLLRIDEVSKFFDVTDRTVYAWYKMDRLQGCKIGTTIRIYRKSAVELIIKNNGNKSEETEAEVEEKLKKTNKIKGNGFAKRW